MSLPAQVAANLRSLIRDVPDWPEPGVVFKDITPLLADPGALAVVVDELGGDQGPGGFDLVAGIEARGFVLGASVAYARRVGFVPVRKGGKLPGDTVAASYALEYGTATIEVHADAIRAGQRVLVVDDVLATGGTAAATIELLHRLGAVPVGFAVLLELEFLGGRARLGDLPVHSLLTY